MWESLKSLLRISKHNVNNIDNSLFTIKVLKDFDEKDLDKVIAKLKNKSIDGFILKRALSKAQTESLVKYFSSLEERDLIQKRGVGSYPKSFLSLLYGLETEKGYFKNNEKVGKDVLEKTGFDLQSFFLDIMSKFNGNKKGFIKSNKSNGGTFAPLNFRSLSENESNIPLHCEDCHYSWMTNDVRNLGFNELEPGAIPFYITLQKSNGGNLLLFDARWTTGQITTKLGKDYHQIINPDGTKINCSPSGVRRMPIDTEPGDLIIFNGNEIWHMVERGSGGKKRLTVGGFLNTTKEGEVEIWA